ncbi:helix-turn-helix domain-containing protein [Sinomicrobium weinanense]|uniref:AraC family transcriptional regulator n=1 Tax=Sinomicrobium weinanense TaxID=2842200 RepID=A0A926JT44_9FLAO|nr:helix-turn-helix domain-containing protein [Sinomicrobium weinanense]MBC9796879.1 AraC family transcriptional regulator [Sinomicrobium weinanense]MBU3123870.1 helix-turn-helix domain-containing protein [Sinomicrobium weinanense]
MRYFYMLLLCILFLSVNTMMGQERTKDTLSGKTYKELNTLFYEWLPKDTLTAKKIADIYIEKGRAEKDSVRMAKGHYYYASAFGPEMGLQYADTIIALTKNSKDKTHPAVGYLLKGYWYFHLANYRQATNHYLTGYEYAVERNNIKQLMGIRPAIGALKGKTGDYQGALKINKEHLTALENDREYKRIYCDDTMREDRYISHHLNAMFNLSLSYIDVGEIDSAKIYARKGIDESLKHDDTMRYYWGVSVGGKAEYYDGNYQAALDSIHKALPHLTKERNVVLAKYYMGKSYEKSGQKEKALSTFLEVDTAAEALNYKFRELRQVYEYMIDYHSRKQEKEDQLFYVDKLLKLDKELMENRAMDGEITRNYDTPHLLRQKEKLISALEQKDWKNRAYKLVLLVATVLMGVLLVYYYQKQRIYKLRYRKLMYGNHSEIGDSSRVSIAVIKDSGVPEEIFRDIEKALLQFENTKRFTNPEITLHSLAKELNTNSTYLSRVINTSRKMNFSKYLQSLRVDHIIYRLKNEERLYSYSISGIAEEAGYNTAQSFASSFYRHTGIYPSYFVKNLKEEKLAKDRTV